MLVFGSLQSRRISYKRAFLAFLLHKSSYLSCIDDLRGRSLLGASSTKKIGNMTMVWATHSLEISSCAATLPVKAFCFVHTNYHTFLIVTYTFTPPFANFRYPKLTCKFKEPSSTEHNQNTTDMHIVIVLRCVTNKFQSQQFQKSKLTNLRQF